MTIEHVLTEYHSQLKRFLSARMRNKGDVEDVLQEIMIKTFRHFESVKEPAKFRAWLYQTARNTLIDYYRKNNKKYADELGPLENDSPQADKVRESLTACLRPFVRNLPEKYRAALEAVEFEHVEQKELSRRGDILFGA